MRPPTLKLTTEQLATELLRIIQSTIKELIQLRYQHCCCERVNHYQSQTLKMSENIYTHKIHGNVILEPSSSDDEKVETTDGGGAEADTNETGKMSSKSSDISIEEVNAEGETVEKSTEKPGASSLECQPIKNLQNSILYFFHTITLTIFKS